MRTKVIAVSAAVLFVIMQCSFSFAAEKKPKSLQEQIAAEKEKLNSTEWAVSIMPNGIENPKAEPDTISFADGKFTSSNMINAGFAASDFSMRIKENMIIWETMQKNDAGEIAMWRGDIFQEGVMSGVMSRTDTKGNIAEFNFTATKK